MAIASRASFFDFTSYHTFQPKYLKSQIAYYEKNHHTLPKWLVAFFEHKTDDFLVPSINATDCIAPERHKAYTILLKTHLITQELVEKIQESFSKGSECTKCYTYDPTIHLDPFKFYFPNLLKLLAIPQVQEAFLNTTIQSKIKFSPNVVAGKTTTSIKIRCVEKKSIIEQNK